MVRITDAPQVSGIEGSYRNTCEISMRVLRDNKESLMAVLEAFVYDPLINWRLMPTKGDTRRPPGEQLSIQTEMSPSSHTRQVTRRERQIYLASMHTSKNPFAS
jgi:FKBP12-rapamycin complex-associated protein